MPSDYNNWCPEIYRGLFVNRYTDDKVLVAPCCQARGKVQSVDTFDFNTDEYLNLLRDEFSQGKKPSACQRCWDAENIGQKSRRQSAIEFFKFGAFGISNEI